MKIQSSSQKGRRYLATEMLKGLRQNPARISREMLKLGDDAYCGSVVSGNHKILMRMDEMVLLMTLGDPTGHLCVTNIKWEVS